jgi:hypothetical protein
MRRARRFFAWLITPPGKGALFTALALVFVLRLALERQQPQGEAWLSAAIDATGVLLWAGVALALVALLAGRRGGRGGHGEE